MQQENFLSKLRKKYLPGLLVLFLAITIAQPKLQLDALVIDGPDNTITGTNSNYVNATNSGSYAVDFMLSGSLDANDTVQVVAMDGSGMTSTGTYVSTL